MSSSGDSKASLADRLRDRLSRGTSRARKLIDRVKELLDGLSSPRKSIDPPYRRGVLESGTQKRAETPPPVPTTTIAKPTTDQSADQDQTLTVAPEFATATMGNILLAQGRAAEAQEIFARLIARNPRHAEARAGLEASRRALGEVLHADEVAVNEEPTELLDRAKPPDRYGVSEARALPVDPTTIVVFWELADRDLERAQSAAGPTGVLALRVVSHRLGAEPLERVIVGMPSRGDWFVRTLPNGATHDVEVGMRTRDGFVPWLRGSRVTTPRGRPTGREARVRATVVIPKRTAGPPERSPRIVDLQGPHEHVVAVVRTGAAVEPSFADAILYVDAQRERGAIVLVPHPFQAGVLDDTAAMVDLREPETVDEPKGLSSADLARWHRRALAGRRAADAWSASLLRRR